MPDAPWRGMSRLYVGWIPNVLGHISFSLIGKRTYPKAVCASHEASDGRQLVAAYQRKQSDDYAWPMAITRWTKPLSVHDWFLTGETSEASYPSSKESPATDPENHRFHDSRGMLLGRINVVASKRATDGILRHIAFRFRRWRFRRSMRQEINRLGRLDAMEDAQNTLLEEFFAAGIAKYELPTASIRFCLVRTGEARFWFDETCGTGSDLSREVVAQIAYYFLKDVAHLHTNHAHSQDGMIPFQVIEEVSENGERDWQRRTIWALSRSIEEFVRQGTRRSLRSALGMIPYAESFHSLYGGMLRKPEELHKFVKITDHEFDHYAFEGMRKLVTSALDTKLSQLTRKSAISVALIPVALSSVISLTNLAGGAKKMEWPPSVKMEVAAHPLASIFFILLMLWLVYAITYGERDDRGFPYGAYRAIVRFVKAIFVSAIRRGLFGPTFWWNTLMGLQALIATVTLGWAIFRAF